MNNSQEILNIIMQHIDKSGKTSKECLISCGINTSFLTDWKNGKIKTPSYDKVVKLAEFLNIDLSFLFIGKEKSPSLPNDEQELLSYYKKLPEREQMKLIGRASALAEMYEEQVQRDSLITMTTNLKVYDIAAGAGVSTPFSEDDNYTIREFPQTDVPTNATCGIYANGNSMEPKYPDGCLLWVRETQEVNYGDIVIAILNGEPFFKILQQDGLHSINKAYKPIPVTENDTFSVFGKVLGYYVE